MPATPAVNAPPARPPGSGVELREDVPLKAARGAGRGGAGAGGAWCAGGPRLIPAAFGALSACITLALLTQIYCGDYEVVPHGSVSSSAADCSRAGTDALKAGGHALDAAAAAALCLAVVAPHRTSLDASGALLYWEYRESRTQQPTLFEWGAPDAGPGAAPDAGPGAAPDAGPGTAPAERPPRLVAALAFLHARLGALPWAQVLAPAIHLASAGFQVSEGLALATPESEARPVGSNITAPELARYLSSLRHNTSAELAAAWGSGAQVRSSAAAAAAAGAWRVLAGGARAPAALRALHAALAPPPDSPENAQLRVIAALQREASTADATADADSSGGVATGLAVIDHRDTYIALVTGLSAPFGSGGMTTGGWRRDDPRGSLDLAPALMLDAHVCGTRYVLGAESGAALAQAGAALVTLGAMSAVERARVAVLAGGALAPEPGGVLPAALPPPRLRNATPPYAAVNLVLQCGDALASHADSRGGGLASRF